jgi:hypothetical protein
MDKVHKPVTTQRNVSYNPVVYTDGVLLSFISAAVHTAMACNTALYTKKNIKNQIPLQLRWIKTPVFLSIVVWKYPEDIHALGLAFFMSKSLRTK